MSLLSFRIPAVRPGRPQPLRGGFDGFGAGVVVGLIGLGFVAVACVTIGLLCGCSAAPCAPVAAPEWVPLPAPMPQPQSLPPPPPGYRWGAVRGDRALLVATEETR